jgi:CheY-like chemotaxis protein
MHHSEAASAAPAALPLRVFIIDDDPDHLLIIRRALDEAGLPVAVEQAEDAATALRLLVDGAVCPDLILLDINMPGLSGFDLLRAVKAEPVLRRTPVVMLTSSELLTDVERAYELGASGYISKPSKLPEMRAVLSHTLLYWSAMRRAGAAGRSQ